MCEAASHLKGIWKSDDPKRHGNNKGSNVIFRETAMLLKIFLLTHNSQMFA